MNRHLVIYCGHEDELNDSNDKMKMIIIILEQILNHLKGASQINGIVCCICM